MTTNTEENLTISISVIRFLSKLFGKESCYTRQDLDNLFGLLDAEEFKKIVEPIKQVGYCNESYKQEITVHFLNAINKKAIAGNNFQSVSHVIRVLVEDIINQDYISDGEKEKLKECLSKNHIRIEGLFDELPF